MPWKRIGTAALAILLLAGVLGLTFLGLGKNQDRGQQAVAVDPLVDDQDRPYPESLRHRSPGVAYQLLREDFEPLWYRKLAGTGKFNPMPIGRFLNLLSPDDSLPTLLVLDDDPQRRWYRFNVTLSQMSGGAPGKHQLGVFFGLSTAKAKREGVIHCFAVKLDEKPREGFPHGWVVVGTLRLVTAKGSRGAVHESIRPLPQGRGIIPLTQSNTAHLLSVHALQDRMTIRVDEKQIQSFDMSWLHKEDPQTAELLTPLGALGIWSAFGWAQFHQASITALAVEEN